MTTPRYFVLPYKSGSKSAKALAVGLGGKVLRLESSRYHPRPSDVVINWGHHDADNQVPDNEDTPGILNADVSVSDKLEFFQTLTEHNDDLIPDFWTLPEDIPDDAFPVVCRTLLNSHSGNGIVIADTVDELVDAPLYVEYIKKAEEYRVHIGRNKPGLGPLVFSAQQKKIRQGFENPDYRIRNHHTGFIYARNEMIMPACVFDAAVSAFEATVLDFGAFDVIYNRKRNKAYVLEVNTAPGLEGRTITDYVNYFKGLEE